MTPTPDDVRKALDHFRAGTLMTYPHDVIARFADAVLNPPELVASAIDALKAGNPPFEADAKAVVADWFVSLITPAAKETP